MKYNYKLSFLTLIFPSLLFTSINCFAFRPIGHVILKNEIVEQLPAGNFFKAAMKKYPEIAAWGAVGPDLGYNPDLNKNWIGFKRQIKNSSQLADIAHYNHVGTFVKNLIKQAKCTNDTCFAAFVGGWITHIAGDFGSHGIYVEPEAGYYIADTDEDHRDLHGNLERYSDAYLYDTYSEKYNLPKWDDGIDTYWYNFFGVKGIYNNQKEKKSAKATLQEMLHGIEYTLKSVYVLTYNLKPSFDLVHLAYRYNRALGVRIPERAGFDPVSRKAALDSIKLHERKEKIDLAFKKAIDYAKDYLADNADENLFSDNWNLDIGPNDGGATYAISIIADKGHLSKTKNSLYVQFTNDEGKKSDTILLTPNMIKILRSAVYQDDNYIYHVNIGGPHGGIKGWTPEHIISAKIISKAWFYKYNNVLRITQGSIYNKSKMIGYLVNDSDKDYIRFKKGSLEFKINSTK